MQLASIGLLFLLMTIVGLELTGPDFRRVAQRPRAVWIGALGQLTLLPLAVGALLFATDFPPELVGGAILVTAAPGAGASNLFTLIGRGNVALSVTLTAVGSLAAVFAIPLVVTAGFGLLLGSEIEISIPVLEMTLQLVVSLLIPIALGMWMRQRRPDLAQRWKAFLGRAIIVGFVVLMAGAIAGQRARAGEAAELFVPGLQLAALWALAAGGAGILTALAAGCRGPEAFTVIVEFTSKNGAVAFLVALGSLGKLELAFFTLPYVMIVYPLVGVLVWLHRRSRPAGSETSLSELIE